MFFLSIKWTQFTSIRIWTCLSDSIIYAVTVKPLALLEYNKLQWLEYCMMIIARRVSLFKPKLRIIAPSPQQWIALWDNSLMD